MPDHRNKVRRRLNYKEERKKKKGLKYGLQAGAPCRSIINTPFVFSGECLIRRARCQPQPNSGAGATRTAKGHMKDEHPDWRIPCRLLWNCYATTEKTDSLLTATRLTYRTQVAKWVRIIELYSVVFLLLQKASQASQAFKHLSRLKLTSVLRITPSIGDYSSRVPTPVSTTASVSLFTPSISGDTKSENPSEHGVRCFALTLGLEGTSHHQRENERERMRIRLHTPATVMRWLTDTDSTCYIQRMTLRLPAPQTGHHYEPVDLLAGLTLTLSWFSSVIRPMSSATALGTCL